MDAESSRIQTFLRRSLGLIESTAQEGDADDVPLTPRRVPSSRRAAEYRMYWLERKRALAEARQADHPGHGPMRTLATMEADLDAARSETSELAARTTAALESAQDTGQTIRALSERQSAALSQFDVTSANANTLLERLRSGRISPGRSRNGPAGQSLCSPQGRTTRRGRHSRSRSRGSGCSRAYASVRYGGPATVRTDECHRLPWGSGRRP